MENNKKVIVVNENNNTEDHTLNDHPKKVKKEHKFWKKYFKPALVSFVSLAILTGIIYPIAVTVAAQAIFPVQANGSLITVTLEDGTKRTYGSSQIGQQFTHGYYLLGRDNSGVSNLSPTGFDINFKVASREERLVLAGYQINGTRVDKVTKNGKTEEIRHYNFVNSENKEIQVPDLLLTASGSGVDPDITVEAASFQVDNLYKGRNAYYTEDDRLLMEKDGKYYTYVLKSDDVNYKVDDDKESYLTIKLDDSGKPELKEYTGKVKTFGFENDAPVTYQADSIDELKAIKGDNEYPKEVIQSAITKYTKHRFLYIFGEETVNTLCVNLALDGLLSI